MEPGTVAVLFSKGGQTRGRSGCCPATEQKTVTWRLDLVKNSWWVNTLWLTGLKRKGGENWKHVSDTSLEVPEALPFIFRLILKSRTIVVPICDEGTEARLRFPSPHLAGGQHPLCLSALLRGAGRRGEAEQHHKAPSSSYNWASKWGRRKMRRGITITHGWVLNRMQSLTRF